MSGYTQLDLDRIRKAKASGVVRVEIKGKITTFRSISDMSRIEREIESCLEQEAEGTSYRPSRRKAFVLIGCRG